MWHKKEFPGGKNEGLNKAKNKLKLKLKNCQIAIPPMNEILIVVDFVWTSIMKHGINLYKIFYILYFNIKIGLFKKNWVI